MGRKSRNYIHGKAKWKGVNYKMTYTKKERDNYNQDRDLTCERLGTTKAQYNKFRISGQSLKRIYVMNCNGDFATDSEYEEACSDYYSSSDNLAKKLGLEIFYQTDPRGATIYLSKEKIEDNNYNRSGSHCIY